ncbi:MAG TPA: hypothetical protein VFC09_12310 [Candidatus Dormibacteraeota bacterium]|nr:hypothetical protein [Candidatus Dormibacteraeota bacterium]
MPAALTQTAALAGAADTGSFLAARRQLFRTAPQRAAGSVAALGLWLAVAASSKRDRGGRASGRTLALASVNAAGQLAMLGVHLKHRIAGPRVWVGAALGSAALAGAVASR